MLIQLLIKVSCEWALKVCPNGKFEKKLPIIKVDC